MNYDVIIFDLDDTLMPEEPLKRRTFMRICTLAGKVCGIDAESLYETLLPTAREIWHQSPETEYCVNLGFSSWEGLLSTYAAPGEEMAVMREWVRYYRKESWRRTLAKFGDADRSNIDQLATIIETNGYRDYPLYDDALPCLEELSGIFPLAMLTNGVPDIQYGKIEGAAIKPFFSTVLVSGEIGYGKPDVRIFNDILDRLGVEPEKALMVGNSLKHDIAGAQVAGMKTAWVNRDGEIVDGGIVPDIEVPDLFQLVEVLKSG